MPEPTIKKVTRRLIGAATACLLLSPAAALAQTFTLPPADFQKLAADRRRISCAG